MKAPAIELAGRAGVAAYAAPMMTSGMRPTGVIGGRWRVLLGALLLALTPGLATAVAGETEEWPTRPDQGPRTRTKIPWMRFSGDPNAPVMIAGQAAHAQEVVVVREREPTRRERRLLRRAERHAAKAAKLRAKTGDRPHSAYAVLVPVGPVVHEAPPPPPPVVVERAQPKVHVVHVENTHEQTSCPESEREHRREAHAVRIDVERLSADVERQVARALRDAERAQRDAHRAMQRDAHRHHR